MHAFRNPQSAIRNRRSGVTLVEVVIAIFVLTVGVLGIISLFPTGYRLGQMAFDRSVASLAARDALPRLVAAAKTSASFFPTLSTAEPLYKYQLTPIRGVEEWRRVGTISAVQTAERLQCRIRNGDSPSWPGGLTGYYLLLTSGASRGSLFQITTNTADTVSCSNALFRIAGENQGVKVRIGDHFAIIGSKTGRRCFPNTFLTTGGSNRTWEAATHGAQRPRREIAASVPWEYSYGCIISAPSLELQHVYRVDVFVFRAFNPAVALDKQEQPAGHFVTYITRSDDYSNMY